MESIFPQVKKASHHRSNNKLFLKDNSSKLMLYQYSKHKPSPPKLPSPISLNHMHSNTIDHTETRVISPPMGVIPAKVSIKMPRSKRRVHGSESSNHRPDNYPVSTYRPDSAMEGLRKLSSKSHRKHHASMKETSKERVLNIYGTRERRNFSSDEKQRLPRKDDELNHISNIKVYYEHFQKKSKELLKKLQLSVLTNKHDYDI